METTIVYWAYIGILENKMETTILLGSAFEARAYLDPLRPSSYYRRFVGHTPEKGGHRGSR